MHHGTAMMDTIIRLREKYNLHMKVERYLLDDEIPDSDNIICELCYKVFECPLEDYQGALH